MWRMWENRAWALRRAVNRSRMYAASYADRGPEGGYES